MTGLICFNFAYAQFGDSTKISFSGIIYNSDALKSPLGQVTISKSNLLGTSSNTIGEFNLDVEPNDTQGKLILLNSSLSLSTHDPKRL